MTVSPLPDQVAAEQLRVRLAVYTAVRHLLVGDGGKFEAKVREIAFSSTALAEAVALATMVLARVQGGRDVLAGLESNALNQLADLELGRTVR